MSTLQLPISCQLDSSKRMFRILRAKGKTLSSGGFGVGILADEKVEDSSAVNPETKSCETNSACKQEDKKSHDFLFIEEVLFLFERGLLECIDHSSPTDTLDASQLYQMLPMLGVALPLYFVYSHLRSQDFRVLRHHPDRLDIIKQQSVEGINEKEMSKLKQHVKKTLGNAILPRIPNSGLEVCYDCYMPNTNFSKYSPGIPDFYVSTTFYHGPSRVSFQDCQSILENCQGIPCKIATVSDSGTVVILGVTNFGVPVMLDRKGKNADGS